jgi:hypothetical protein
MLLIEGIVGKKVLTKILSIIAMVELTIISAIRATGADFYSYYVYFKYIDKLTLENSQMEIGYYYLNKIIHYTNSEYAIFFVTSILIMYLFYKTLSKYSKNILLSITFFLCLGMYTTSFNILRQYIAIGLIFYSLIFIASNKKYIFLILAILFHYTAIIIVPFYIVSFKSFSKRNYFLLFIGAIIAYFIYPYIMNILFSQFNLFTEYQGSDYVGSGANPLNFLSVFPLFFIMFLERKNLFKDKINTFSFNMCCFSLVFLLLGTKGLILVRIADYFKVFCILLIPNLLKDSENNHKLIIYFYVLVFIIANYITIIYVNYGLVVPYKTIFSTLI